MNDVSSILDTMEYGVAPEDDKIAREWIKSRGKNLGHFINGEFIKGAKSKPISVISPIDGEEITQIPCGSKSDVDEAVKTATAAQKKWARLSGHQRARHLYAIARNLQKHSRLLAVLETIDNGKPIRETRDIDIPLVARHFLLPCRLGAVAG